MFLRVPQVTGSQCAVEAEPAAGTDPAAEAVSEKAEAGQLRFKQASSRPSRAVASTESYLPNLTRNQGSCTQSTNHTCATTPFSSIICVPLMSTRRRAMRLAQLAWHSTGLSAAAGDRLLQDLVLPILGHQAKQISHLGLVKNIINNNYFDLIMFGYVHSSKLCSIHS